MFSFSSDVLKMKLFVQILCEFEEFPLLVTRVFTGILVPWEPLIILSCYPPPPNFRGAVPWNIVIWSRNRSYSSKIEDLWFDYFFKGGGDGNAIIISEVAHPI